MLKHFKLIPFLVGVAIGLLVFYFYKTPPLTVYEYPHPQNVRERVYRDHNGVCYKYDAAKVDCDANEATLKTYPIQGGADGPLQ